MFLIPPIIWERGTHLFLLHSVIWKKGTRIPRICQLCSLFYRYFGKRNTFVPSAFSNLKKRNAHSPNMVVAFLIQPIILERGTHLFLLHSVIWKRGTCISPIWQLRSLFNRYFGKGNTLVPSAFSNLKKRNAHSPNMVVAFLIPPIIWERGTHLFLLHSVI